MSLGTPVVVTAAGAVPEVVGDAALVIAPEDTAALAAALGEIVADSDLRSDLVGRGRARAAQFSWTRCADQMVDLYRRAAAG
jgi:glycosyltransferase involved in cell wall biosynthesis